MFEAKLTEGLILKKIVDSIKDIVTDVNIDISPSGKFRLKAVLKRKDLAGSILFGNESDFFSDSLNASCLTLK